jgi:putative transposase
LRHAFIAAHQGQWPISVLCEVLEVSRSGFYDYQSRQAHPTIDAEEVALLARVKAIAGTTRSSYGSRRMAKALQEEGFAVGRVKTRRLMKEAGVQVQRAKRRAPVTTDSRHGYEVAPNLLARHFDVDAPDSAWVGDITYVWTAEGWLYVSTVLDLYSRKVVGWAMSSRINTALVADALKMALGRRRPLAGLIHHSDRGSQYASHAYRDLLKAHGIECSMSGKGDCLDNAVAERFFGSLKREWTSHRDYDTRQEARDDIIEYIEMFYNSKRKHSYLGYLSPNDYEKSAGVLN